MRARHNSNLPFEVQSEQEAKKWKEEQVVQFHHIVAQLLFISIRARRGIQMAVAFLTTRAKGPDKVNLGKIKESHKVPTWNKELGTKIEHE